MTRSPGRATAPRSPPRSTTSTASRLDILATPTRSPRRRRSELEALCTPPPHATRHASSSAAAADAASDEEEPECAICLEPLSPADSFAGACGHAFHRACMRQCRAANATKVGKCPLCRADMPRGLTPAHAREACVRSMQQRMIAGRTGRAREAVRARMNAAMQRRRLAEIAAARSNADAVEAA